MNWIKHPAYQNIFNIEKYFGKYRYVVTIQLEERAKSLRYWVHASSGKKRKELDIFQDKENKSLGGVKALFWIKEAVLDFPEYYNKGWNTEDVKEFICIGWADNRRRNIYQRLEKEGFYFMNIEGQKILIKEIIR